MCLFVIVLSLLNIRCPLNHKRKRYAWCIDINRIYFCSVGDGSVGFDEVTGAGAISLGTGLDNAGD